MSEEHTTSQKTPSSSEPQAGKPQASQPQSSAADSPASTNPAAAGAAAGGAAGAGVEAESRAVDSAKPAEQLPSGERVLTVVRPAMFRAHPFRYILIVLMFFGGLGLAAASAISDGVPNWLVWPGLFLSLVAAIWFCQWWFVTHLSFKITITNKRTTQRRGFFSRRISEVLHEHIRNIRIDQSLPQRILKVGHLRIDTAAGAASAEVEIDIQDIPDPHELKSIIDPYRNM